MTTTRHYNANLMPMGIGFKKASLAIAKGTATAHPLWAVLHNEEQREGYLIRPSPWEGPGDYQHVSFSDGRKVFVRIWGTHLRVV